MQKTREQRIAEVKTQMKGLSAAITAAEKAEGTPKAEELWADVSKRTGAVQRRTRQLAGLSRGG